MSQMNTSGLANLGAVEQDAGATTVSQPVETHEQKLARLDAQLGLVTQQNQQLIAQQNLQLQQAQLQSQQARQPAPVEEPAIEPIDFETLASDPPKLWAAMQKQNAQIIAKQIKDTVQPLIQPLAQSQQAISQRISDQKKSDINKEMMTMRAKNPADFDRLMPHLASTAQQLGAAALENLSLQEVMDIARARSGIIRAPAVEASTTSSERPTSSVVPPPQRDGYASGIPEGPASHFVAERFSVPL